MSQLVRRYLPVLKRIRRLGEKKRRQFIRGCEKEFLDCMGECAKNVLKGNVPLSSRQMSSLRSRKHDLRSLARKKTATRTKRKILQKGGFLTALIPPVLAVLTSLLTSK